MSKKAIDLVSNEDGVYCLEDKRKDRIQENKSQENKSQEDKSTKKYKNNMDQFIYGMDIGLDFLEDIKKRVDRLMKLKD